MKKEKVNNVVEDVIVEDVLVVGKTRRSREKTLQESLFEMGWLPNDGSITIANSHSNITFRFDGKGSYNSMTRDTQDACCWAQHQYNKIKGKDIILCNFCETY